MKTRIYFNEVVTRDGLQNEAEWVEVDAKVALIDELGACGYAKIEVTSFFSPTAIAMLRDAEEVMGRLRRVPGACPARVRRYIHRAGAQPPRRRAGAERALESRADELNLVLSASEILILDNPRMPRANSFTALTEVVRTVGAHAAVNVSLSCSFGCAMESEVVVAELQRWAQSFADLSVRGLTLCDTTGMAHPAQVRQVFEALQARFHHPTAPPHRRAWRHCDPGSPRGCEEGHR